MALKALEELGDLICEAIAFAKEQLGFSSLDKIDNICKTILPDLEKLDTPEAEKLASAAYDLAKRVKETLIP